MRELAGTGVPLRSPARVLRGAGVALGLGRGVEGEFAVVALGDAERALVGVVGDKVVLSGESAASLIGRSRRGPGLMSGEMLTGGLPWP